MSTIGPAPHTPASFASTTSSGTTPARRDAASSSEISLTEVTSAEATDSQIELAEVDSDVELTQAPLHWSRAHPTVTFEVTADNKGRTSLDLLTNVLGEHRPDLVVGPKNKKTLITNTGRIEAANIRTTTDVTKFKADPVTKRLIVTVERSITLRTFESDGPGQPKRWAVRTIKFTEEVDSGVQVPEPCDEAAIEFAKNKASLNVRVLSSALTRGLTDLKIRTFAQRGIVPVEYTTSEPTSSFYTLGAWSRKVKRGLPGKMQLTSARLGGRGSGISVTDILLGRRSNTELQICLSPKELAAIKRLPVEGLKKADQIKEFEKEYAKIVKRQPQTPASVEKELTKLVTKMQQEGISTDELVTIISRNAHGDVAALYENLDLLKGPLTSVEKEYDFNLTGGILWLSAAATKTIAEQKQAIADRQDKFEAHKNALEELRRAQAAVDAAAQSRPPTAAPQMQQLGKDLTTAKTQLTEAKRDLTAATNTVNGIVQKLRDMRFPRAEGAALSREESLANRIAILEFISARPALCDSTARRNQLTENSTVLKEAHTKVSEDSTRFTTMFDKQLKDAVGPIEAHRIAETTPPQFSLRGKDYQVTRTIESSDSFELSFIESLKHIPGTPSDSTPESLRTAAANYCRAVITPDTTVAAQVTDTSLVSRIALDMHRSYVATILDREMEARRAAKAAAAAPGDLEIEEVEDPNERMKLYIELLEKGEIQSPRILVQALSKAFNVNIVVSGESDRRWNEDETNLEPSQGWNIPQPSNPKGTVYLERTAYMQRTATGEAQAAQFDAIVPTNPPPRTHTLSINGMDYTFERQHETDSCVVPSMMAGLQHIRGLAPPPPTASNIRAVTANYCRTNFKTNAALRELLLADMAHPRVQALIAAELAKRNAAVDISMQAQLMAPPPAPARPPPVPGAIAELDLDDQPVAAPALDAVEQGRIRQLADAQKARNESEDGRMNIFISLMEQGQVEAVRPTMFAVSEHYQVNVVVSQEDDRKLNAGRLESSPAWRGLPTIAAPRGTIYLEAAPGGAHFDAIVPPARAIPNYDFHAIAKDGNCFYNALLEGLKKTPLTPPIANAAALRLKAQQLCTQYLADPAHRDTLTKHILESASTLNQELKERYTTELANLQSILADTTLPAPQRTQTEQAIRDLKAKYDNDRFDLPEDGSPATAAQTTTATRKYLALITTDRFWGSPAELYALSIGLNIQVGVVNAAHQSLDPYGAWRNVPPVLSAPIGTIYLDNENGNHFNVMLPKTAAAPPPPANAAAAQIAALQARAATGHVQFYDHTDPVTYVFGNFYPSPVTMNGITFATAEGAFQAVKYPNPATQALFRNCDGDQARDLVRKLGDPAQAANWTARGVDPTQRPGWIAGGNITAMLDVLREKYKTPALKAQLLATGNATLTEHAPVKGRDIFWTDDHDGSGINMLGLLLMQVRGELGGTGITNMSAPGVAQIRAAGIVPR